MNYDCVIRNGRVIDPLRGIDAIGDVFVLDGRIVDPVRSESGSESGSEFGSEPGAGPGVGPGSGQAWTAAEEINARGCLVLPGLIDFHTHLAHLQSELGLKPDLTALPNGITAAVDAGTTGAANFEPFFRHTVSTADLTIRSFLNLSPTGTVTEAFPENMQPETVPERQIHALFNRYPDALLGIKTRIGRSTSQSLGMAPMLHAKRIARDIGTTVCVHVVDTQETLPEIVAHLGKNDVLCHCFQKNGPHTILGADGKVLPEIWAARRRGVVFDAAAGRGVYSFEVIRQALADGFLPDIISSDAIAASIYDRRLFSLVYVLSAYLALGLNLSDIVRACTATPARLMRLQGTIGTLAAGAQADITVLKLKNLPVTFTDRFGVSVHGQQLLVPQLTMKAGRIMYKQIEFLFNN